MAGSVFIPHDILRGIADRWGETIPRELGRLDDADGPYGRTMRAQVLERVVPPDVCDGCGSFVRPYDATEADELVLCVECDRKAAKEADAWAL